MTSQNSTYPVIDEVKTNPERLTLLFSPFRSRSLNPEHYDAKLKFWYRVIQEFCESEGKVCFTITEIELKLEELCGKEPICLQDVIENLVRLDDLLIFVYFEQT